MRLTYLGPQRLGVPGAGWLPVLLVLSFALHTSPGTCGPDVLHGGVCSWTSGFLLARWVLGSLGPRSSAMKWNEAHLLEEREG